MLLDPRLVRTMLRYDPESGTLTWKLYRGSGVKAGDRAGYVDRRCGYLKVRLNRRVYFAHRVIWAIAYGKWPKGQIDHIDRNKTNNRLANLRDVTQWQNHQNRSRKSNAGEVGVYWKGYEAAIRVSGKKRHLGYFDTIEEAKEAYLAAAAKYYGDVAGDA